MSIDDEVIIAEVLHKEKELGVLYLLSSENKLYRPRKVKHWVKPFAQKTNGMFPCGYDEDEVERIVNGSEVEYKKGWDTNERSINTRSG